jgi:superfamily II DNA/RNA helicase
MISQILHLLQPLVCKLIYALKWKSFRPVQERMIRAFFGGQADLVAAAPTSGGKTEAAALPLLSDVLQYPVSGFSVVSLALTEIDPALLTKTDPGGCGADAFVSKRGW